jgi:hypothetical protein
MTKRIIVGSLLAGLAMFIWGSVSHIALGLEESAIKEIPNEDQLLPLLQTNIKESGFYFFPGMGSSANLTKEQKAAAEKKWTEKYTAGPYGIMIYHPEGEQPMSPRQLVTQFGVEIVTALVAALVLAQARGLKAYLGRVGLVTLLGLLPFFVVNVPYWNWYGFPPHYTLIQLADKVITFFVAGLVLAALVKPAPQINSPATA